MLFSAPLFLFGFLPLVLLAYYAAPARARIGLLAAASYTFYGWWDWRFLALIAFTTTVDYCCARAMASRERRARRPWLLLSLVSNLGLLGFFKYFGLGVETADHVARWFGGGVGQELLDFEVVLPVGISFFVFQSLSYTVDVYRDAVQPSRSLVVYACYVSLFPQLVAGPIVRYRQLERELRAPVLTDEKRYLGAQLFLFGLAKKVVFADSLALFAEAAFDAPDIGAVSGPLALVGVLAYTFQIYFDFSGYSDMAAGIGHMLGFTFPKNFDSPYKSASITEFWQRWHISLSTWLRDYLFLSLGGSARGVARACANVVFTMLLGGLWHGAGWNFVLWGGYHGALLAIERALGPRNPLHRLPLAVQRAVCFALVAFGLVFFRAATLDDGFAVLAAMTNWQQIGAAPLLRGPFGLEHLVLASSVVVVFFCRNSWQVGAAPTRKKTVGLLALSTVTLGFLLGSANHPFLYFQF
jgi:alginate O-acetyltransferase complex protein AlgI